MEGEVFTTGPPGKSPQGHFNWVKKIKHFMFTKTQDIAKNLWQSPNQEKWDFWKLEDRPWPNEIIFRKEVKPGFQILYCVTQYFLTWWCNNHLVIVGKRVISEARQTNQSQPCKMVPNENTSVPKTLRDLSPAFGWQKATAGLAASAPASSSSPLLTLLFLIA